MTVTRRNLLRGAAHIGAALAASSSHAGSLSWQTAFCTTRGLQKVALRLPQSPTVAMLHPERLPRFVDPLPIPTVLRGGASRPDPEHPGRQIAFHHIAMRESWTSVHRDLPPMRFWGYDGKLPGPTIEARTGEPLLIEWGNELPQRHFLPIDHTLHGAEAALPQVRAVVHVHGARVPAQSDGFPEHWSVPGSSVTYRYPNRQDAATLWYHDHTMGIERLNVYAGLLGAFFIRDPVEEALRLPSGEFEIPLMIFDRQLTADGQLYYPTSGSPDAPWVSEAYGDVMLINGKIAPYLDVEARPYRFRIVNASNARFYYLSLSDGALSGSTPLQQIGSDQGLLPRPIPLKTLTLAPAERADVIIDFSRLAGQKLTLDSQAFQLMQFRVKSAQTAVAIPAMPPVLREVKRIPASAAVRRRKLTLDTYTDPQTHMMLMLLNATYWHQPVTERPVLGSTEIWEFLNLTEDTHPIHLHLVRFQLLDRQRFDVDEYLSTRKLVLMSDPMPPADNESGWKDTVQTHPGLITRIIVPFEGYPGRYVWHCHVLEHSANEMMRPFEVVRGGSGSLSKA